MASIADLEKLLYDAMLADTVESRASQVAPVAGTDITTVSLSPGSWEITAIARLGIGGTPAAGDVDNMRLRNNTGGANLLTLPVIAVANSTPVPITIRKTFLVTTSLVIEAVGAGTASVVYIGHLICRKVAAA